MLNKIWGRGIWIENTIFTVWLFIGVLIFSLLLAMIYGKSTGSKNSWEEKGATHTQKESMYTMTLIFLSISICRFYVYWKFYISSLLSDFEYINKVKKVIQEVLNEYNLDSSDTETDFEDTCTM